MRRNIVCVRRSVELQGFRGLDDVTIAGIERGLRVAPAICMVWTAFGTVLGSPLVILCLAPFAMLGALLPGHPFDVIYRVWLRRVFNGVTLPPYPFPRRFACLLATAILCSEAYACWSGWRLAGTALGLFLVAAASVNVTTGFCLPSFLLKVTQRLVGRRSAAVPDCSANGNSAECLDRPATDRC